MTIAVDYHGSKLRLIVDLTSSNCSHQVQQLVHSTMYHLDMTIAVDYADSKLQLIVDLTSSNCSHQVQQ